MPNCQWRECYSATCTNAGHQQACIFPQGNGWKFASAEILKQMANIWTACKGRNWNYFHWLETWNEESCNYLESFLNLQTALGLINLSCYVILYFNALLLIVWQKCEILTVDVVVLSNSRAQLHGIDIVQVRHDARGFMTFVAQKKMVLFCYHLAKLNSPADEHTARHKIQNTAITSNNLPVSHKLFKNNQQNICIHFSSENRIMWNFHKSDGLQNKYKLVEDHLQNSA